jgi:streptogrisin D
MRMKMRTVIGFAAACTLAGALSATTYAPAFAAGAPEPVSPGATGTSALIQRQILLSRVANQIISLTRQGRAAGYSGYGDIDISLPQNLVTLYWKGTVPATLHNELVRLRRTAAIRVVAAPYTWLDLEAQTHRISGMQAELSARGITLSRVGPLPGATGVQVAVDPSQSTALKAAARADAASTVARAMPSLMAAGPAPVTVTTAPMAITGSAGLTGTAARALSAGSALSPGIVVASRNLDDSPWWGGDRIVRSGQFVCSSGFSLINSAGHQFMLTAGHCGGIGTVWRAGTNQVSGPLMGTEVNRDSGGDTAIIAVNNNEGWIWDKGWNSTVGEQVIASATAIKGNSLCTEGATSGVRCSAIVQQTGIDLPLGGGETAHNEVYATGKSGQQIDATGDSGGPVIGNSGIAGDVIAFGTMTALTSTVGCSNISPGLMSPLCGSGLYFEDLNAALNHWVANLYFG